MNDHAHAPTTCDECGQPLEFAQADEHLPIDPTNGVPDGSTGHCRNPECPRYEASEWLDRPGTEGGANGGA